MTRNLLAIESSTDWLSVALLRGEDILELEEHPDSRQHASALLPAIDTILARAGWGLGDLDAIGVATGPGSFTSLRIGLATVKGLAFGTDRIGIGVSTLEAMALSVLEGGGHQHAERNVVSLLDARCGEWYAGGWRLEAGAGSLPTAFLREGLYAVSEQSKDLKDPSILMTPLAEGWQRRFEDAGIRTDEAISDRRARPRADWVGRLAQRRLDRGEGVAVSDLEARYLRRAEAEAKRLGAQVEEGEVERLGD